MNVIPVMDLRDGHIVHAVRGQRHNYAPLVSCIGTADDPVAFLRALLSWHPFERLYIADLNAIEARGNAHALITALTRAFPALRLWVDGGFRHPGDFAALGDFPAVQPVIGTETLATAADYAALRAAFAAVRDPVLSLDHAGGRRLGPAAVFEDVTGWPDDVIVMNLDRVGANAGPDWPLLEEIRGRAGSRRVIAAGGVRDAHDLAALRAAGIDSVLVASALHNGALSAADLRALQADRPVAGGT